nr:hypothetical protein CFP56_62938 [Quercus suber]
MHHRQNSHQRQSNVPVINGGGYSEGLKRVRQSTTVPATATDRKRLKETDGGWRRLRKCDHRERGRVYPLRVMAKSEGHEQAKSIQAL